MAGVLLEALSNKSLLITFSVLLIVQIVFFLIGGLICPKPNNVQPLLGNKCFNPNINDTTKWFARNEDSCKDGSMLSDDFYEKGIVTDARQIVFSWKFPLPKNNEGLTMSPWHQNMIAVFKIEIEDTAKSTMPEHIFFDAKLGYKDVDHKDSDRKAWTTISSKEGIQRTLSCSNMEQLECDLMPLFELGSVHHDEYLINLVIPSKENRDIGKIYDIWVYVIHQNGGFTFMWFAIKTIVFPILATTLLWFIWKLSQLTRKPNVLERTLLAVGAAITLLNFPVDWLTLKINMPFMLLYSDIRQGLFYSVLFCFWIVFTGEHRMDQVKRDGLKHYGKQLAAVGSCCVCMFLFDFCERGIQLANPFFSIWSTKSGSVVAFSFVVLAGISAVIYLIFFLISIVEVFKNICIKRSALPGMSKPRQKYYKNLIYRFSFLMVFTIICAVMTMVMYFLGQAEDKIMVWDAEFQMTSAVQTGVYGMWNIYVFCLLILYSPSMKYTPIVPIDTSSKDEVEFSTLPSENGSLFIQKEAIN